MKYFRQTVQAFNSVSRQTKRVLRFGAVYCGCILLGCVSLLLLAGRGVCYYTAVQTAKDLFQTLRPCIGVTGLGGLLYEGALHIPEQRG